MLKIERAKPEIVAPLSPGKEQEEEAADFGWINTASPHIPVAAPAAVDDVLDGDSWDALVASGCFDGKIQAASSSSSSTVKADTKAPSTAATQATTNKPQEDEDEGETDIQNPSPSTSTTRPQRHVTDPVVSTSSSARTGRLKPKVIEAEDEEEEMEF